MKLNIFGKQVNIIDKDISDTPYEGFFDPNTYDIVIDTSCENKFQTVLHEILHSVWFRIGMPQTGIPWEVHELIVENFATAIDENFDQIKKLSSKYKNK